MGPTKKAVDIDAYVNEDNWDDADGYYNLRVNEILHDRYEVVASRGKGVFSTVVFAKDIKADDNIRAIKLIRSNDVMYRAGQKEIKIAHSLQDDDPHNKMHIIRLLEHFEHKGHLCLVFEPMYMNLREVLRQFGRGVGINVQAVAAYGKQLFTALKHMKAHGIIHCDLKPDNILVNRQKNLVRVCDLGSAMYLTEVEITPYVCSRFYRPPEVILGLAYDCQLDVWSMACVLYELFTGKIMFQGRSNNHMLKLMQEVKGKIPPRMVKKGLLGETFFDEDGKFLSVEIDPMSKQEVTKRYLYTEKPNKDLKEMLLGDLPKPEGDEMKKLEQLRDFLDRALMMDPGKRLTVEQALSHPFLRGH
jgi:serine/threonine-protein kinase PRP4